MFVNIRRAVFYGGRVSLFFIPVVLVLALLGLLTLPAGATSPSSLITVTTTDDELNADGDCSLREAIEAANTNMAVDNCPAGEMDKDIILLDTLTYPLSIMGEDDSNQVGDLDILDSLVISGTGATIDAQGIDRIFHVDPYATGVNFTLADLTITNGVYSTGITNESKGGGIYITQGRVYLNNTTISNNYALGGGGGIYLDTGYLYLTNSTIMTNTANEDGGGLFGDQGVVHMLNTAIDNNVALSEGGGVHLEGGALHMDNGSILANSALHGGGIYSEYGLIEMENGSRVSNNTATNRGGGIDNYGGGLFIYDSFIENNTSTTDSGGGIYGSRFNYGGTIVANSLIQGNSANQYGGAIYIYDDSGVIITNTTIINNSAELYGGALTLEGEGSAHIYNSQVFSNTSYYGAGLQAEDESTIYLVQSEVAYNTGVIGGGIYIDDNGGLYIQDSYIHHNSITDEGGGIFMDGGISGRVESSTISDNTAGYGGGVAFMNNNNSVAFVNTTVSGNTATDLGGGIYAEDDNSSLTLEHVTLVNNSAGTDGHGLFTKDNFYVTAHGSLILGNGGANDCGGDFTRYVSAGVNLVDSAGVCPFSDVSDQTTAGANLFTTVVGPLAFNGGFAPSHAPLAGSPVVDAAPSLICTAFDQDGNPRPQGNTCDIGSVESDETATVPTIPLNLIAPNTTDDELNSDGDCSLREAVEAANTNTVVDGCPAGMTPDTAIDLIMLSTTTYNLTIPGAGEDNNQTGDLDITETVFIVGQDSDFTTIASTATDRIIDTPTANNAGILLRVTGVTLMGGDVMSNGGAIHQPFGALLVDNSVVQSSVARIIDPVSGDGGGIFIKAGALYLTDAVVAQNTAENDGGGIFADEAVVEIRSTDVMSNTAADDGGGLGTDYGTIAIENSNFISNTANFDGGGTSADYGLFVARNSNFLDNYANNKGGGIYAYYAGAVIENSQINGNVANTNDGGGLYTESGGFILHNSRVNNNSAGSDGGGIYHDMGGLVIRNSEINGNTSSNEGGGLRTAYGAGFMRDVLFDGNSAEEGGGLYTGRMASDIRRAVFRNNVGSDEGGGINYYYYGAHILADSVIENNTSELGGGLFTDDEPTLFLERVTIANNIATSDGGGIYGEDYRASLIELLNVTLSGNMAMTNGGAIYTENPVYINYSTIVDNDALVSGGGLYLNDDASVIQNSIIGDNSVNGDNTVATANCFYGTSAPTSNGFNVFSDMACNVLGSDLIVPANGIIGMVLDPLANNGGPLLPGGATLDTHALVDMSVAIDAGEGLLCPMTDARGVSRPGDVFCDIGAYEQEEFVLIVLTSGTGSGTVLGDGINCGSDCTEIYSENTVVTLTATADVGSTFIGWSGDCSGMGDCVVTMSEARSVTANFTLEQYALTVSVVGEGSVGSNPAGINCPSDCTETYDYNTLVILTASSAAGYSFSGWSGACSGTGDCEVIMSEVQNVMATFVEDSFELYMPIIINN